MQYSFVLAALGASAVMGSMQPVGQITDGQIQVSTGAAETLPTPVTSAPVSEETVFITKHIVTTSCGPEVVSCPARSYHTTSTVIPVVKPSAPAVPESSAPVSLPNSPIQPSAPVVSIPAQSIPSSPEVPVSSAPVVPGSPNSPVQPSAPAVCPTCPTCPAAVTVTVTATPVPSAPASPALPESPAASESSVPAVPASPNSPVQPIESSPASPNSPAQPIESSPASPVSPGLPLSGAPAPSGTAASTGVVPYAPTGSPITPFKGAASSLGSSIAMAGLAAFAAIILV